MTAEIIWVNGEPVIEIDTPSFQGKIYAGEVFVQFPIHPTGCVTSINARKIKEYMEKKHNNS